MLKSVVKEIFFKRGRRASEDETPDEDGRYYRFDTMVSRMRQRSEALRHTAHVTYPRVVHLETIAICNAACVFCPSSARCRGSRRCTKRWRDARRRSSCV